MTEEQPSNPHREITLAAMIVPAFGGHVPENSPLPRGLRPVSGKFLNLQPIGLVGNIWHIAFRMDVSPAASPPGIDANRWHVIRGPQADYEQGLPFASEFGTFDTLEATTEAVKAEAARRGLSFTPYEGPEQVTPLATPDEASKRKGGRQKGIGTVPAITVPENGVLEVPDNGAIAFLIESIMAPPALWERDALGIPQYSDSRGATAGNVRYIHPGQTHLAGGPDTIERRFAELFSEVCELSPAEIQLFVFLNNQWLSMANPREGIHLNAARYAQYRNKGQHRVSKDPVKERDKLNGQIHRLASLVMSVTIAQKRLKRARRGDPPMVAKTEIVGRMVEAFPRGQVVIEPLDGFEGPRRADVAIWRLAPGDAWMDARKLNQIGRYPHALLELDPYHHGLQIRLGVYLGHQATVRATAGTIAQPLTVRSLLQGIREPIPEDRRRRSELGTKIESALDDLQKKGILWSWRWTNPDGKRSRGEAFLSDTFEFVYHKESNLEHIKHHPRAQRAFKSVEVQRLLPEADRWA